jgi:hypothetical protein
MSSVSLTYVCARLTNFIWMNAEAAVGNGTPTITIKLLSDVPASPRTQDYYLLDGGWVVQDIKVYKSETDCGDFIPSFSRIGCNHQYCYFCMEYANPVKSIDIEELHSSGGYIFLISLSRTMICLI